jgi:hypothetical protein
MGLGIVLQVDLGVASLSFMGVWRTDRPQARPWGPRGRPWRGGYLWIHVLARAIRVTAMREARALPCH